MTNRINLNSLGREVIRGARKFVIGTAIAMSPGMLPYLPSAVSGLAKTVWPNADSMAEAHKILEEEKENIGIDDDMVLRVYENDELSEVGSNGYSAFGPDGKGYVIGVNKSSLDRILIRHELAHIKNGDVTKRAGMDKDEDLDLLREQRGYNPDALEYHLSQEPRAVLYSVSGFGIKNLEGK
jgi:hypothetical protein